ncbi:hypothetical protein [Pantoea dispersa]|uniref:hypothetical protein n=1 Tax=Pantoea dispersa TaxID=59814 RepID=UPI000FDA79CE|nr:hypothetical protein [Pantoea dispersa]RVU72110.1 hypothetical protein EKH82_23170 [Pantoea dispersa]
MATMRKAHCVCPDFVAGHITDPLIFDKVFMGALLSSDDQILLDKEGRLDYAYTNSLNDNVDGFTLLKAWKISLSAREKTHDGKVLLTSSTVHNDNYGLVIDIAKRSASTFKKCILAYDNNSYAAHINELTSKDINLYNLQNVMGSGLDKTTNKEISMDELIQDILYILHLLARTKSKGSSEDDYNDHLRNGLKCKDYEVSDQSREGTSSSGLNAGELDIVINRNGCLRAIIEAMKLSSLDQGYINEHYKKLITNYNPLQVSQTCLVTYYTGNRFDDWWQRYNMYIENINLSTIGLNSNCKVIKTEFFTTPYANLRYLIQHFEVDGENLTCAHICVKF